MRAKPLEQHKRDGTYRRDRHGDGMALLIAGRPDLAEFADPPSGLDRDAAAQWRRIVPDLIRSGIVDRSDLSALELLCEAWADIRKHRRVLRQDGMFSRGSTGQLTSHPSVRMLRDAVAQYSHLATSFGLDPLARTKLAIEGLQGRVLETELAEKLGPPVLRSLGDDVVDGTAVDDVDDDDG